MNLEKLEINELTSDEMMSIDGGRDPFYYLGYALGLNFKIIGIGVKAIIGD